MSAATDYLESALLNHVLRNTAYTSPTTVYLALFTTATSDAAPGTEVTGGSYARQAVAFNAPSGGAVVNTAVETFTNMPACTVTHWGIFDAVSAGNMLFHGALSASKTYLAGEDATVAIGALSVSAA